MAANGQPNYGTQPPAGYQQPPNQQGYPPAGQGYPPEGQGYPPAGQAGAQPYPPAGAAGQPYPHAGGPGGAGQAYPPAGAAGQAYPPGVQGYQQPGYAPPAGPVTSEGYQGRVAPAGAAGAAPPLPVPGEDVMFDPNAPEPTASAPPLDALGAIAGYNNVGFSAGDYLPPPAYGSVESPPPAEHRPPPTVQQLTDEAAKVAMVEHVNGECCWGAKPAKELIIKDLKPASVFHYTLETFCESRATAWAYEPYNGGPVDGPAGGPAPGPWEVMVQPSQLFVNSVGSMEVPHTASVIPCHDCAAMGRRQCHHCKGRGRVRCHSCHGRGHEHIGSERRKCTWCHGDGRRRCTTCGADGMVRCKTCKGKCKLKCYIKLTTKWTNHYEDSIQEGCALPQDMVRKVSGELAFQEENTVVWPVTHFPDQRVNSASKTLVDRHRTAFPSERTIRQRQKVRIVPITEVIYEWRGAVDTYWVYGQEKCVYAPKYPQQCCCGCTIL